MFFNLLKFEIKDRLLRASSLVYFLVFLFLSFMMAITFAGAFKGATVSFGLSNKLAANSPLALNYMISLLSYISLLVIAPLFGQSINKDFENKFSQIIFATPIKKSTYFFVRYFGSVISSFVILVSVALGIFIASLMPFVDRSLIIENKLWFYIAPYVTNVIPNILIFGAIFIAVISFFKKMAPVYVASIATFTGWLIANGISSDLDNKMLASIIEPFGLTATNFLTRYWSVAEQTTRVVPLEGFFLYNRLVWSIIGFGFLIFAYFVFNPFKLPAEKKKKTESHDALVTYKSLDGYLQAVELQQNSFSVFLQLAKSEFKQAFSNIYFLMILLCGILYIFSVSSQVGKIYGTETLPVTNDMVMLIGGSFGIFVVILTTFFSGELVWKERDHHFYELVDSKPISSSYLYFSKLLALISMQVFLNIIILVCCVIIQTFKGYYNYEWSIYFSRLFFYSLPTKIFVSVLALFIHSLSKNKYIGHSIVIIYWLSIGWLPSVGLDHKLYLVGQVPFAFYSDMNKYGTSVYKFLIFCGYWSCLHIVLALVTMMIWRRGSESTFKTVINEFKRQFGPRQKILFSIFFSAWVLFGGFIFYNTNILNQYESTTDLELSSVNYEKRYKSVWENEAQLDLIKVHLNVEIYPESQSLVAHGNFKYKNKSQKNIQKVFINILKELKITKFEWSQPTILISEDKDFKVQIYEFKDAVKPNEEVNLEFITEIKPTGFENKEFSKKIVENGSFFYGTDFSPVVGYQSYGEIEEEKTRRKYDLPPRPRMADVNDLKATQKTYISSEATWIDFDAVVSTSADQIAIAPGYIDHEWKDEGRNYYHYKMDKPILNFYAFLSAKYEVARDQWNDIKIEVYHHPTHTKNTDRMINSVKKSLDYFSKNFSPYQFRQFRIFEVPNYSMFAQAFPNTIPFSEALGFIAKVNPDDPESIDYPFYITAHELAHQWWAHQVISGRIQGATMLSESLAQYSALMVQEKEYGAKYMRKFLKYELDRYLSGRSRETTKELPIALNENQLYIHYSKGSLVFYALKDYLGEDVVNKVLSDFLMDYAFKDAPFPRAVDLVERFRKVTPADKKYLIVDLFDTITLYDNRTESVTVKKDGGKYKVTVTGYCKKTRSTETGTETEIPMNDFVDVGLFDKKGEPIYLQKHQLKSGENKIELNVDQEPYKGGIDPLNKLIDKVSDDNQIKVLIEN